MAQEPRTLAGTAVTDDDASDMHAILSLIHLATNEASALVPIPLQWSDRRGSLGGRCKMEFLKAEAGLLLLAHSSCGRGSRQTQVRIGTATARTGATFFFRKRKPVSEL